MAKTTLACIGLSVCFLMPTQAETFSVGLDASLYSTEFFNQDTHVDSQHVVPHWWKDAATIDTTGLNNHELMLSAQSLKDNSMSLNHKLLNYHWLNNWHRYDDMGQSKSSTRKQMRRIVHTMLDSHWRGYSNNVRIKHRYDPPIFQLKYRFRLNDDKAKLSLRVKF